MLQLTPFSFRNPFNFPSFTTQKFLNSKTLSNSISLSKITSKSTNPNHIPNSINQNKPSLVHKTNNVVQETKQVYEFETISKFNDQLMGFVNSDKLELAIKLFSNLSSCNLEPDLGTYSIMIRCYCKSKEPNEAKRVAHHMLDKGFRPNVATLTVLVNEFCVGGRIREAREIIDMMRKINCDPNIQTYNCLLKGLCYVGRVEEAYEFMISLKDKSCIKPDIYTYTTIMDGFCKVGRSNEALELLDEALEYGLVPNVATYNTLLTGYFKEGKPLEGIGLIKKMREKGCTPDYTAYSTLLHGLLKWGEIREALRVYKEMVSFSFRVDERMMNTLLRGLCRRSRKEKELLNEAYEVFDKIYKWEMNVYDFSFDLIIEAFCRGRKLDEALDSLENMVGLGYIPKETSFDNVIRALCNYRRVDEALKVLVMHQEMGSTSKVSLRVVMDEYKYQGRLRNSFEIYTLLLKLGVDNKM